MAILFAAFLAVGTIVAAFAVDEGGVYLERRSAQAAVDLAAIEAAGNLGDAQAEVHAALTGAGLLDPATLATASTPGSPIRLAVGTGRYTADAGLAVGQRFVLGAAFPNAAYVRLERPATLYFAAPWGRVPTIAVEAVASAAPTVRFSVGSTLAELQDGIANAVLNGLLGANVSLSAASYDALLTTHVSLFAFLDALAQELGVTAGTYNDVLAASADQGTIARALADAVDGPGATDLLPLAQALGHNGRVPIGKLLAIGDAGRLDIGRGTASGYDATLGVLELLAASAAISDGAHQVALGLAANVPGLTSLTMDVAIGEPARFASWFALGPSGTIARTAQIRISLVATLAGGAALGGAAVRVPLYVAAAYADAAVQSATCPAPGESTGGAVIAAEPGVVRMMVGDVDDARLSDFGGSLTVSPATLIGLPLLRVTASGVVDIGQNAPTLLDFSAADVASGTIKRAATTTIASSLVTSLLAHTALSVSIGGLGAVSTGSVTTAVAALLAPLGPVLDSTLATTLNALGLTLGAADVKVYGVSCRRAVLVR